MEPKGMPMNSSTKPLLQKMGLKPGIRIAVLGFADRGFMQDIPFETCLRHDPDEENTGYDVIVIRATGVEKLSSLRQTKRALRQTGALWIVYPKGIKAITQKQVLFSGNAEGFTDCKVCSFSQTETALKFVRRRKDQS
jgi:hypothetical protein